MKSFNFKLFNLKKKPILYKQIFGIIITDIFCIVLFLVLANTFFLGKIYRKEKVKTLTVAYKSMVLENNMKQLYKKSYRNEFEKMCLNGNLSIVVMAPDGKIVMSSTENNATERAIESFKKSVFFSNKNHHIYYSTGSYTIEKQEDKEMDGSFLVLWGSLPDGNIVFIRTAMESMKESAKISNRFLAVAGIMAFSLSYFLVSYIANRITKPITELSDLSRRMKDLDFNTKYTKRKKENEIDILGKNFNDLSDTLEKVIGELKASNKKLTHELDILSESDKMRKEFLSNVSHELKTPIALIEGYAEGLSDGICEDEESKNYYLSVIIDESKKMDKMVKQLLSLNRLEFGNEDIEVLRFDIVPIIKGLIKEADILLKKYEVTVLPLEDKKVFVWGDSFLTEQVIENYFSNAIHYAEGKKEIKISLKENKDKIILSIFNTGKPIPDENKDHVFEKFYKVDKARSSQYGGSGIGLSIVKAISKLYNEECGLINHKNGVEFYFTFDKG